MLIDRSHRNWAVLTAVLFSIATLLYVAYAWSWPGGPSGRTWPGMLFGVAGTLLMVVAGLLSVRKKTVLWRLGSLSWWLTGHIWLALLSVPLIFYHAAFRWGGTLEVLLWITLSIVTLSGAIGLVLQNILPRMMQLQLPSEAIPDQFAEVCNRLIAAADEQVTAVCTPAAIEAALARSPSDLAPAQSDAKAWLADFYIRTIRPFLGRERLSDSPFAKVQKAEAVFDRIRKTLPDDCATTLDRLETSCDERRQLAQQERLQWMLHGWLKIHVTCSVALLVFGVVHVVSALYY